MRPLPHHLGPEPVSTEHQREVEAGSVCVSLEDQFLEGRNYDVLSSNCWRGLSATGDSA